MNKALIIGISMFLLLVVPALAADWDVKWSQDLCNGIVHHCYEINFSNKGDAKDFNMSLVFSESDINLRNIRNLEIDEIVETTESYKDNIIDNCNNVTIKRVNETVIEPNCTYKEVTRTAQKTNLVKQNALTSSKEQASYKENIGKINFGNSLTRRFRVEYDLPIVNSNGFGSSGKLAFVNEFTNEVYHPWWNYSYFSCKNMTFQETGVVKRINQFMIYNLTELDGMQPDADDVRIVNSPCGNDGSEVSYDLVSNTSNSADIAFIIPEINKSSNLIWAVYYNNSNAAAPVYSGKITYRDWNYTDHAAGYNVSLSSGYNVYFDNISDWYTGLWGIDHLSGSVSRFKNYNDAGNADAAHLFQIRKWDVNVRLTIVIDGVAFARVRLKKNNQSFTFDCPSISRPNSAYCSVQFSDPDYSSYYIVAFSENAQGLQDNDSNWVAMKSNNDTDDFHGLVYPSNSGFNLVCYVAN